MGDAEEAMQTKLRKKEQEAQEQQAPNTIKARNGLVNNKIRVFVCKTTMEASYVKEHYTAFASERSCIILWHADAS